MSGSHNKGSCLEAMWCKFSGSVGNLRDDF